MTHIKIGRNDPCHCGSGKKFKKCCLNQAMDNAPTPELSPSELVLARGRAFSQGDFAFIYDTYHPDSNFRQQFPDRLAYIQYGNNALGKDFTIDDCRVLHERVENEEARVIFYLATTYRGQKEEGFELSLFYQTDEGWRYHSSQKLGRDEFNGSIEEIGWDDFEKVKDKVFF